MPTAWIVLIVGLAVLVGLAVWIGALRDDDAPQHVRPPDGEPREQR